jgi:hypothetical protein
MADTLRRLAALTAPGGLDAAARALAGLSARTFTFGAVREEREGGA